MVSLNQVNAPFHRLLIILNFLVRAEGVGENENSVRVTSGDEFLRQNFPGGVHGIGLQRGGQAIDDLRALSERVRNELADGLERLVKRLR